MLGSRGRGPVASLLLGSVSVGTTQHARCPVVVLRPEVGADNAAGVGQHVVVGVVHGQPVGPAVEFAFRQCSLRTIPLVVLHAPWEASAGWVAAGGMGVAIPSPDRVAEADETATAALVAGLSEKFADVEMSYTLGRGLSDDLLVGGTDHADMIVVGTAHPGLAAVILEGNLARSVTEHAHCLVAVVPEPWAVRSGPVGRVGT